MKNPIAYLITLLAMALAVLIVMVANDPKHNPCPDCDARLSARLV